MKVSDMVTANLPRQPTSFIGRETEIDEIVSLLADPACRLLTLMGPGGIGKTRLAVETMQQFLELKSGDTTLYSNGIYFISFQPIGSPDFMVSTIAETIGCQFHQERDPRQQLLNYLRKKSMLLMLDNLEHLTDGLQLLSDILNTALNVRILATSRERLNLQEEWVLDIGGLDYPTSETLIEIEGYSAVQLFLLHAHRVHARFSLDEAHKRDITRICRLVEGMPLAIELAASWVRMLPCETIAAEIEHGLDILETSVKNIVPRHQNLRATLDPTWNRLPKIERTVYKKLSVFRGGFTREAAEAVVGASLRTLSALLDKSLIRVDADGRFDMHELLRQYAEEQLAQDEAEVQQVRNAHAAYFTELMKRCEPDLNSRRQQEIIRELDSELDNIRAAWRWAVDQANIPVIQAGAHAYWVLNDIQGRYQEVVDTLTAAIRRLESLASTQERDYALAVVSNAAGQQLIRLGRFDEARTAPTTPPLGVPQTGATR
jgi:predicted ATPase